MFVFHIFGSFAGVRPGDLPRALRVRPALPAAADAYDGLGTTMSIVRKGAWNCSCDASSRRSKGSRSCLRAVKELILHGALFEEAVMQ